MSEKRTYRIPCYWEMYGEMKIEANSLKEAIKQAKNGEPLPPNSTYVEDSFEIDNEIILEWYPENEEE